MAELKKADAEKLFVAEIKGKIKEHCAMYTDKPNTIAYRFLTEDGRHRYWTNLSDWALKELGLEGN